MITEELEHNIGAHQTLSSAHIKHKEREELNRQIEEFMASGGEVYKADPTESYYDKRYNNYGPLNPANTASKDWAYR